MYCDHLGQSYFDQNSPATASCCSLKTCHQWCQTSRAPSRELIDWNINPSQKSFPSIPEDQSQIFPHHCSLSSSHSSGTHTLAASSGFSICVTGSDLYLTWLSAHLHIFKLGKTTEVCRVLLWEIIPRYSLPSSIICSDNGLAFITEITQTWQNMLN